MPSSIFNLLSLSVTGIFGGIVGYAVIGVLAVAIVLAIVLAIVSSAKSKKNKDDAEEEMYAELSTYYADGIIPDAPNAQTKDAPVAAEEIIAETPQLQEVAETPAAAPVAETVSAPAKKEEPVKAEQLSEENPIPANSVPEDQRQGDWSNYDGEYDGYYYDPIDACYYEGKPPVYVQKMYLPPVETIVRKIKSPAAPLSDKPLAKRAPIKKKEGGGLDIAIIYGQYVIEHNEEGEYFFTLYDNKDNLLYESFNYANEQYCRDAVKRFKKHVLAGAFSVEGEQGSYHFVLVRKINTYLGPKKETRTEAETSIKQLKYYAQTDVVRAQ